MTSSVRRGRSARTLLLLVAIANGVASCRAEPRAPYQSIVLVTLDTLRRDHLGCYGYPRPTSPFLDRVAASGVLFTRAISASSHTAPAHASLFTSLYPTAHGVVSNGIGLSADSVTLAGVFGSNDFETAAFLSVRFLEGLTGGFDVIGAPSAQSTPFRTAPETTDAALEWLEGRRSHERFFLWVHFFDAHEYAPSVEIDPVHLRRMREDSAARRDELLEFLAREHGVAVGSVPDLLSYYDRYDAQVATVDSELARLFERADALGLNARTLWVVTADHGEGLFSHDFLGHGRHLYNEQLHVPLLFFSSTDSSPSTVVTDVARHVDLLPTLLELTGIRGRPGLEAIEGRSLAPLLDGRPADTPEPWALAERRPADAMRLERGWVPGVVLAVQNRRYKYIFRSRGADEFFDLERDPLELRNLAGEEPAPMREFKRWLTAKYERMAAEAAGRPAAPVDERTREELRALGYL